MLSPYSTIAQAAIVELEAEIARLLEIQVRVVAASHRAMQLGIEWVMLGQLPATLGRVNVTCGKVA